MSDAVYIHVYFIKTSIGINTHTYTLIYSLFLVTMSIDSAKSSISCSIPMFYLLRHSVLGDEYVVHAPPRYNKAIMPRSVILGTPSIAARFDEFEKAVYANQETDNQQVAALASLVSLTENPYCVQPTKRAFQ